MIVNSDYRDLQDFDAGASASRVVDALGGAGFEVTLLEDVTVGGLLAALRTLRNDPDPNASAVLYYAGYARQVRGRNYIIARDAKPSAPFDFVTQGVGVDGVLRTLAEGAGRLQLAVIDGAYPEPLLDALPALEPGLAAVEPGATHAVVTGTTAGEILADAASVESFASTFAEALQGGGAPVSTVLADFESMLSQTTGRRVAIAIGGDSGQPLATPAASTAGGTAAVEDVGTTEIQNAVASETEEDSDGTFTGGGEVGGAFQAAPQSDGDAESAALGEVADPAAATRPAVLDTQGDRERVQTALKALGLYPGVIDGVHGQITRQGISTFQRLRGFPVTGTLTQEQIVLLYELAGQ